MYLPKKGVFYPGIISTNNFDNNAAYEHIKLLTEISRKKTLNSHYIKSWIKSINSAILDNQIPNSSDDENDVVIDESKKTL